MNERLRSAYDLMLANAPEAPNCTACGHPADDHESFMVQDSGREDEVCYGGRGCRCQGYSDEPPERDPDERYDRWRELE